MRNLPQGKDDVTGEPLVQHDDDKPEALMARLRHYKDVAKPVMDLYKSVTASAPWLLWIYSCGIPTRCQKCTFIVVWVYVNLLDTSDKLVLQV